MERSPSITEDTPSPSNFPDDSTNIHNNRNKGGNTTNHHEPQQHHEQLLQELCLSEDFLPRCCVKKHDTLNMLQIHLRSVYQDLHLQRICTTFPAVDGSKTILMKQPQNLTQLEIEMINVVRSKTNQERQKLRKKLVLLPHPRFTENIFRTVKQKNNILIDAMDVMFHYGEFYCKSFLPQGLISCANLMLQKRLMVKFIFIDHELRSLVQFFRSQKLFDEEEFLRKLYVENREFFCTISAPVPLEYPALMRRPVCCGELIKCGLITDPWLLQCAICISSSLRRRVCDVAEMAKYCSTNDALLVVNETLPFMEAHFSAKNECAHVLENALQYYVDDGDIVLNIDSNNPIINGEISTSNDSHSEDN